MSGSNEEHNKTWFVSHDTHDDVQPILLILIHMLQAE